MQQIHYMYTKYTICTPNTQYSLFEGSREYDWLCTLPTLCTDYMYLVHFSHLVYLVYYCDGPTFIFYPSANVVCGIRWSQLNIIRSALWYLRAHWQGHKGPKIKIGPLHYIKCNFTGNPNRENWICSSCSLAGGYSNTFMWWVAVQSKSA